MDEATPNAPVSITFSTCRRCNRQIAERSEDLRYCLSCYFDIESAQLERDDEKGDDDDE